METDALKQALIEAGREIVLEYFKNDYKRKISDMYLTSGKYTTSKDIAIYESYIRDIDDAESMNKILDIYMEALDLINSKTPDTPFSKKKS